MMMLVLEEEQNIRQSPVTKAVQLKALFVNSKQI